MLPISDKDIVATYYDDIKERATLAKSARTSVASKSTKPVHTYTDAQIQAKHQLQFSFNFNEPMLWTEFTKLPKDCAQQYIAKLLARYDIGPSALAIMFDADRNSISHYLKQLGFTFRKGKKPDSARFLSEFLQNTIPPTNNDEPAQAAKVCAKVNSISFNTVYSLGAIDAVLSSLFESGASLTVTVTISD